MKFMALSAIRIGTFATKCGTPNFSLGQVHAKYLATCALAIL